MTRRGHSQAMSASHTRADTQPDSNSSEHLTRLDVFLIGSAILFVSAGPIATAITYAVYIVRNS